MLKALNLLCGSSSSCQLGECVGEKNKMKLIEFYLNGVLITHIIFFLTTFRYVHFLRKKSYTLRDNLDWTKRYKIVGKFFSVYPIGQGGHIDMHIYADLSEVKHFVGNGDDVALSAKFLIKHDELRLYKVHTLYAVSESSINAHLNKHFSRSVLIGYTLSLTLLLYEVMK